MALKLRKDIKKSSYYVWFLGAKESKGLRGNEYILPVIKHLEQRERDIEPFKVTLQVSHKGLKIIQNITTPLPTTTQTTPTTTTKTKTKNEIIKHFIPHNTITCCYQQDDIIACILLLFNPVTKCPLHIHAYRCDSLETATLLKQQLQTLIERPENQKKFAEIENRLKTTIIQQQQQQPAPLQQQQQQQQLMAKKRESSLGSDRSTRESESSEERYPMETNRSVTTLYDSVAAELRAKLKKNNVPILLPPRDYDTVHRQKGNLTGIELRRCLNTNIVGQNVINNNNNNNNSNNSNNNNNKGSKRLESSGGSSGIGSDHPPSPDTPESPDTRYNTMDNHSTSDEDWNGDPAESTLYLMHHHHQNATQQMTLPRPGQSRDYNPRHQERAVKSQQYHRELSRYLEQPISKFGDNKFLDRQKSLDRCRPTRYYNDDDDDDDDEDEDDDDYRRDYRGKDRKFDKPSPMKYFDDDGFDENLRYRSKSSDFVPRYHYDQQQQQHDYYDNDKPPIPRQRQKYQHRQRSPSPPPLIKDNNTSPRDRFKDAKEKFLQMEQQRYHNNNHHVEPPISPITKDKPFLKRHESVGGYEKNRPKPAPRNFNQQQQQNEETIRYRYNHSNSDNYQKYDKYEPKRRSMFSLIEEEHRKNSTEIAKELKRRSYLDNDNHSKSTIDLDYIGGGGGGGGSNGGGGGGGYRHSYVEPQSRNNGGKNKNFGEILHRTNSISNNGRVGIASIHPY